MNIKNKEVHVHKLINYIICIRTLKMVIFLCIFFLNRYYMLMMSDSLCTQHSYLYIKCTVHKKPTKQTNPTNTETSTQLHL